MGPYCAYCGHRCFVLRHLPADAKIIDEHFRSILMATCAAGMDHDRKITGYDHRRAINPLAATADGGAR